MLINGIDLSTLGIQLYDRILESNNVETTQDWLEGDIQPTYIRQQDKFKNIQLKFLVLKDDEAEAFLVMSKLTSMLKKATIIFDDIDLIFDVTMRGAATQSRLKNGNFILTFNLRSDYAKGATEIYTTDSVATDYFKLKLLYYKEGNVLLATDETLIKASDFNENTTFASLGIMLDKYRPDYFQGGVISNFNNRELTFANLKDLGTLIINYSPVTYQKEIEFYKQNDNDDYVLITSGYIYFTKDQIDAASSLGDIIDLSLNKPNGYRVLTDFNSGVHADFNFETLMNYISILRVLYERIENEQSKEITVNYYNENTDGSYTLTNASSYVISEGDVVPGSKITKFINLNRWKPQKYYTNGTLIGYDTETEVEFDDIPASLTVRYNLTDNNIFVEYYYGTYPSWNRITTYTYHIKYDPAYDEAEDIFEQVGIDFDRYASATYEEGRLFNVSETISTFDDLVSVGVLQVYYEPKEYDLTVKYMQDNEVLATDTIQINETMFLNNPVLAQIININQYRPEGYTFDIDNSYDGEISLGSLLVNQPIIIAYKEIDQIRTKSIVIKYKQEFSAAFSTINTSIITIEESQVGGGVTLPELFNLNAYRPEYYDAGILDGISASAIFTFEEIQGSYDVLYLASSYSTPVRYYTDEIANENWIGSDSITYKVISFDANTTLYDLGLNLNGFKPSYCGNGEVQYTGPVNFAALRALESIDVLYISDSEPVDPSGIDYPHRILFLQHNDMGDFESLYPTWTLNHAYINTGVTCEDVSKLSVLVDTYRVFETEPLYNVNVQDAYLFGAVSPSSSYYIKYRNNTKFRLEEELTGVNLFKIAAGRATPELIIEESSSEGFSSNTGISASSREGYSYGTITYTHLVQSNTARMDVPLYLFACDYNGYYRGGIAGVGIKSCKIYYDGVLIRDFVPVAFFDKIGDQIAPSNCLYDKITQTFFEDARGLNSFNIMDDPDATDTNPEHNIGCCYANYYKDGVLFNTATIWFRESDFVNGNEWIPIDKLFVDYYQPKYCSSGTITNLAELGGVTFNNVKNFIFNIEYETTSYSITVRYYLNEVDENNLINEDEILLSERDFYQVPTFGQIVPVQKYKPDNYKANYTYPETKVTLQRILDHSPYDIVYTEVENPETYTTTVTYLRKVFGITPLSPLDSYEEIDSVEITLDETQFADGVFIDDFINLDAFEPVSPVQDVPFYTQGVPYGWYKHDIILDDPSKLQSEYLVVYDPAIIPINVNYYTDEVDEDNLVAIDTWLIQVDMWPDGEQFQIVDELPNVYINKYKPVICWGGELVNPSQYYTFASLVTQGHVDITYETKEEPHDPDNVDWPSKILWFNTAQGGLTGGMQPKYEWEYLDAPTNTLHGIFNESPHVNITTPYINLGYTPKEIGRLKAELKAYCQNVGIISSKVSRYSLQGNDYAGFFGYNDSLDLVTARTLMGEETLSTLLHAMKRGAAGNFVYAGHTPEVGFDPGGEISDIQTLDGHTWHAHPTMYSPSGTYSEGNVESVRELSGQFRRGTNFVYDEDLNDIQIFKNYMREVYDGYGEYINGSPWIPNRSSILSPALRVKYVEDCPFTEKAVVEDKKRFIAGNPVTITIDAYHDYMEAYDYTNYLYPLYENLNNQDQDVWLERTKPQGPITFGITTNPRTGRINWKPFTTLAVITGMGAFSNSYLQILESGNPYSSEFSNSYTVSTTLVVGQNDDGSPIYQQSQRTISVAYSGSLVDTFPNPARVALWHLKLWDQDRLVRDMVPVKAGDQIYDYIAPANGLFDKVTEIFFSNENQGGTYETISNENGRDWRRTPLVTRTVNAEDVAQFHVCDDWTEFGKVVINYYDENNEFLGNQYVTIPLYSREANESIYDILRVNDFKPDEFHHDGEFDVDLDFENFDLALYDPQTHLLRDLTRYGEWNTVFDQETNSWLERVFNQGTANVYYKLLTFTKTVEYYRGNTRVGSKDIFYTVTDINNATSLADLGVDTTLYASEDYRPGRIVFDEDIIANHDIRAFIDAPSPVVIYDEYNVLAKPDLLYVNWYRGGAYDDTLITLSDNPNYLDCELDATVLNPNGAIKYLNHYHTALYEDEKQDYFIAYQVDVNVNYLSVHKGPGRIYSTLANIIDKGRYTIVEEKRGWGRLREYPKGWILLAYTTPAIGPGRNPAYDENQRALVTIPYAENITISKMTIDRLWCYCPEYSSWIKAQDISFDQSGKLYNAIHSEVVHLDEIDWNNVSTWNGLGIIPDLYRMRYHDTAVIDYSGAMTYAGLSAAHTVEIVNPETVYAYNVCYYKDTFITDETAAGRATANENIDIYTSTDRQTILAQGYHDGDSFLFYGSSAEDTDLLETEDGFIDIESDYTITRPSSLELDYPLIQNTTDHNVYLYAGGSTPMGILRPSQVVQIKEKIVPTSLSYAVYHYPILPDVSTDYRIGIDGSITGTYGASGGASSHLPAGVEIIHTGSIIPTGDYYGTGLALNDISVYDANDEVIDTITMGTQITLLDFENNRYQISGGWLKKKDLKIIEFGPFKVSTQRSFRNSEIGRTSFSCSVSDWNPDWPTFIETSWKYEMVTTPGEATSIDTITMYTQPNTSSYINTTFAANVLFTLNKPKLDVDGVEWYEATSGNYTGFVLASGLNVTQDVVITPDYTKPINPTLYKDTPITLTWDFFGMEANLYKPSEDYEDGLFLWNPRSYDNENVYFTFEELITTGTQAILYLPKYGRYKATFPYSSYIFGAQVAAEMSAAPKAENTGFYDLEVVSNYISAVNFPNANGNWYGANIANSTMSIPVSEDNYYVMNFSDKRPSTVVYAYGNDLNGYHSGYYGAIPNTNASVTQLVKIVKNTNHEDLYWFADNDATAEQAGSVPNSMHVYKKLPEDAMITYLDANVSYNYAIWGPRGTRNANRTLYSLKKWHNFFLQNFIVPFPKGYIFNGKKVKENCLIDILTGEIFFPSLYPVTYINDNYHTGIGGSSGGENILSGWVITPPIITKIGERVDYTGPGAAIDDTMIFDRTEMNRFILVPNAGTKNYRGPSDTATLLHRFAQNTVMPAFASTEDAEHGVEGLWYFDGCGWIRGHEVTIVAAETYPETLTPMNVDLAVKGTTHNTATDITRYLNPATDTGSGSIPSEQLLHIYASYDGRYWTGAEWIDIDTTETNVSTYPSTKFYVVSRPLLNVYTHPLANDAYRLVTIQNGDRISVDTYLTNDEAWKYADGLGWVDSTDSLSEVI